MNRSEQTNLFFLSFALRSDALEKQSDLSVNISNEIPYVLTEPKNIEILSLFSLSAMIKNLGYMPTYALISRNQIDFENQILFVRALDQFEKHGFVIPDRNTSFGREASRNENILLKPYRIVPEAKGDVVAFRISILINYLSSLQKVMPDNLPTIRDLSVHANKFGYSTIAVSTKDLSNISDRSIPYTGVNEVRAWDGYIAHLSDFFDKDEFHNQNQVAGYSFTLLVDISNATVLLNGTTKNAISFLFDLKQFLNSQNLNWDVTIICPKEVIDFFGLRTLGFNFFYCIERFSGFADVGIIVTPPQKVEKVIRFNNSINKLIYCHLDIISLRVMEHLTQDVSRYFLVRDLIEQSDLTIFISNEAINDLNHFYPGLEIDSKRSLVIPEGFELQETFPNHSDDSSQIDQLLNDFYLLLIGNTYPHKNLIQVMDVLDGLNYKKIVIGLSSENTDQTIFFANGILSDFEIDLLIQNAAVVIFPSSYEGFGLPVAQISKHSQKGIYFNTAVSREVVNLFENNLNSLFFDEFDSIPELVEELIIRDRSLTAVKRSLNDFNFEIFDTIKNRFSIIDKNKIFLDRKEYFQKIECYINSKKTDSPEKIGLIRLAKKILKRWKRD